MNGSATENIQDYYHNNNDIKWLKFPYKISPIDEKTNQELLKDFTGERTGFVQVGPKKWFFPSGYEKHAEYYYNFQPRPDDVWIATFPRSGTTWTQEMVWLLANNLNYDKAQEIPLENRFPFLEFNAFVHPEVKNEFIQNNCESNPNCELIEEISKPAYLPLAKSNQRRFIKTHLPFELLHPDLLNIGCKVIYVARNPKDVAVSFFHLNKLFRTQGYLRDFPTYWNYFERNLQPWTPYWEHIQSGWSRRNEDNLLFLFYEEMNKNLGGAIKKVANFLGETYTEEQFERLEDHLRIENFKNNKSVCLQVFKDLGIINKNEQGFVRKGKSGGWRDYFVGDLNQRAEQWIEDNLKNTDIRFPSY